MLAKSGFVKITNLTLERYKEVIMNPQLAGPNTTLMKKLFLRYMNILKLNRIVYNLLKLSGLYPAVTFTAKKI